MNVITTSQMPRVVSQKTFDGIQQVWIKPNEFKAPLEVRLTREQAEYLIRDLFANMTYPDVLLRELHTMVHGELT